MKNKNYNIFLFLSTISRNLMEVLNIALLYKLNYSLKQIILFYIIFYFTGIIVNLLVVYLSNYLKIKYILIISSILLCISYYYLNIMNNNLNSLIIFSILSAFSSFSYHIIRHFYALNCKSNKDEEIGNYLIFIVLGVSLATYINTYILERYSILINIIIVLILGILSIIPLSKISITTEKEKLTNVKLNIRQKLFFYLEQSKVLFLLFEPLYLIIHIKDKLTYIGLFNAVLSMSSIISIYLVVRKINNYKYFKYINIIFVLILITKLNITNSNILLLIAFMEGILTKLYEIVSTKNLYQINNLTNIKSYLLKVEIIFLSSRVILLLIFYLTNINIKTLLYILLPIILLSGFILKQEEKDN